MSLRPRHYFHWTHRRIFVPIAVISAITAVAIVLHSMPLAARTRNSVLAVATLAYFTSVHSPWRPTLSRFSLRIPKELLVGIIFTLACAAPVWTRSSLNHLILLPPILAFIALAWLNCQAIETWESQSLRRPPIFLLSAALAFIALFTAAIAIHHSRIAALLASAAVSAVLLGVLDRQQHRLTPTTLRAAADLVLLTPLALLLWGTLGL